MYGFKFALQNDVWQDCAEYLHSVWWQNQSVHQHVHFLYLAAAFLQNSTRDRTPNVHLFFSVHFSPLLVVGCKRKQAANAYIAHSWHLPFPGLQLAANKRDSLKSCNYSA